MFDLFMCACCGMHVCVCVCCCPERELLFVLYYRHICARTLEKIRTCVIFSFWRFIVRCECLSCFWYLYIDVQLCSEVLCLCGFVSCSFLVSSPSLCLALSLSVQCYRFCVSSSFSPAVLCRFRCLSLFSLLSMSARSYTYLFVCVCVLFCACVKVIDFVCARVIWSVRD